MSNTKLRTGAILGVGVLMLAGAVMAQLVFARPSAQAQMGAGLSHEMPPTITVVGEGTVKIKPDTARVDIGVTAKAATVKGADNEAGEVMDAVLKALQEQGIAEQDIQTSGFRIWAEEQPAGPGRSSSPGEVAYRANQQVMVSLRDLDKVGDILDAAIEAGANEMYGVTFTVSDDSIWQSEARKEAAADALARAQELAALHDAHVDDVISISEVVGGWGGLVGVSSLKVPVRGLGGGGGPVSPGELELSVQLQVVYGMQRAE